MKANIVYWLLIIFLAGPPLWELKGFLLAKKQVFTYETAPKEFKAILDDFKNKAEYYEVDVSALRKTVFIVMENDFSSFGGYGSSFFNLIILNKKTGRKIYKYTVWHELGHAVLGYGHTTDKQHIMSYDVFLAKNAEEKFFKEKPMWGSKDSLKLTLSKGSYVLVYYRLKEFFYGLVFKKTEAI